MRVLICFDCDGTIFTTDRFGPEVPVSQHPIPLERIHALAQAGAHIVVVSPSDACDGLPYPRILASSGKTVPDRVEALREAARRYPADLHLYISDNRGDDKVALQAGFTYLHPDNFR